MSETCIVCLGDLGENASVQPLPEDRLFRDDSQSILDAAAQDAQAVTPRSPNLRPRSPGSENELIAHLLPCGHNLHDECLKPWVERANSCPICRQKFNQVDLKKQIDGPVISSYPVQDRTQVAELDPSLLMEEEDDSEFQPCRICGNDDHEEVLLLCDGCHVPHHTYCVELAEVPDGPWMCEECALNRAIEESMADSAPRSTVRPLARHGASRRTLAQIRSSRNSVLARASDWARIWEQVYDRAHLDLDFPYQDEERHIIRTTSRHNLHARSSIWRRRLQVAEQQGGADEFRRILPVFDSPTVSRPRPEPVEPESIEEVIAWNALEKARDIDHDPSSPRGRKRKSNTNSPAHEDLTSRKRRRTRSASPPKSPMARPEPIQRKRPRPRRMNEAAESSDAVDAVSSRRNASISSSLANNAGPSFLQSLLKEVENSAAADDPPRGRPALSIHANLDHGSPQGSSPEASPTSSNMPSPRGSASPPPGIRYRPGSPSLTSRIEPVYPKLISPDLSPTTAEAIPSRPKLKPKSRIEANSRTQQWVNGNGASSPSRAPDLSPTRASMSLSAKERIQKLVREALKVHYTANKINSDQYTDINRRISRMMYDTIGDVEDVDGDQAMEWRTLASSEVDKAVDSLQPAPLEA